MVLFYYSLFFVDIYWGHTNINIPTVSCTKTSKKKFLEDSNYDFFYSNTIIYNEKNKTYKKYKKFIFPDGKIYEYLAKDYFIIISGLIIKKAILQKENYFNEKRSLS